MRQAATLVLTALHASGLAVHAIEAEGAIVSALDAARLYGSLDDVEKERRASLSAIKHGGRQRG